MLDRRCEWRHAACLRPAQLTSKLAACPPRWSPPSTDPSIQCPGKQFLSRIFCGPWFSRISYCSSIHYSVSEIDTHQPMTLPMAEYGSISQLVLLRNSTSWYHCVPHSQQRQGKIAENCWKPLRRAERQQSMIKSVKLSSSCRPVFANNDWIYTTDKMAHLACWNDA